jgi:hypothetical protein
MTAREIDRKLTVARADEVVSRRPISGRMLNDMFDTSVWDDAATCELRTMGDGSMVVVLLDGEGGVLMTEAVPAEDRFAQIASWPPVERDAYLLGYARTLIKELLEPPGSRGPNVEGCARAWMAAADRRPRRSPE